MSNYHYSVLLQEVIAFLKVKKDGKYIDGTLGGGGHTFAILERGGDVLGLDVDNDALEFVEEEIKNQKIKIKDQGTLQLERGNFREIDKIARENGFERVDGILLDVGVSSHQLDIAERGFSFQDGPLDMRMDVMLKVKASDLVNGLTNKELQELFVRYGEERYARSIAKHIVESRSKKIITTTSELIEIIKDAVPNLKTNIHPATRVFQALRIAVNDELYNLEEALTKSISLLEENGRLVVISFHSLEDRIVKHAFKHFEEKKFGKIITKRPVTASEEEMNINRRSRSAKLRVFEKIK